MISFGSIYSSGGGDYACEDPGPGQDRPIFQPDRPAGVYLPDTKTIQGRDKYSSPLALFKLFFTLELVSDICRHTNAYAHHHIHKSLSYASHNQWIEVTTDEIYSVIAILIYAAMFKFPIDCFWSAEPLLDGLWARHFIPSRQRFKAIMSFLKVTDFRSEDPKDKLCKVRPLLDHITTVSQTLYQPGVNISIDERMVRNKGRFCMRQYIRDKPVKWGYKLWGLACSCCGYTYNFNVYVGKSIMNGPFGLAYDVVMNLLQKLFNQGYHLFVDNFYSSVQLFRDCFARKVLCCGTFRINRKQIPDVVKNANMKKTERGTLQFCRDGVISFFTWKDNKTVTVGSTLHDNRDPGFVKRRYKDSDGVFRKVNVKQPQAIKDYNNFMSGVDRSDQLKAKCNVLRKCNKFWKTLFFHMIDIAVVNSFILFQKFGKDKLNCDEPNSKT